MLPRDICVTCGACCAFYRVSFYWREGECGGGTVPDEYTEPLPPSQSCMKGTKYMPCRCVCLQGEVGTKAVCQMYEQRPSPCRAFGFN